MKSNTNHKWSKKSAEDFRRLQALLFSGRKTWGHHKGGMAGMIAREAISLNRPCKYDKQHCPLYVILSIDDLKALTWKEFRKRTFIRRHPQEKKIKKNKLNKSRLCIPGEASWAYLQKCLKKSYYYKKKYKLTKFDRKFIKNYNAY